MLTRSSNGTFGKNGFTLVEIAIVLVIVGMLVAGGVSLIGPLTTMSKFRDSREILATSAEAINSWAAGNNRIPPSTLTAPDTAQFDRIVQKSSDSWSNPLIYIYDTNLSPLAANVTKNTICGRRSTLITLTDTLVSGATVNNVAYVIISRGDNNAIIDTTFGVGGPVVASGARGAGPAATIITANTTLDIVKWVTLDELRSKAGCQGAPLKIVNNELPPATVAAQYPNATAGAVLAFTTDGGAAPVTLRWCIEASSATPLPAGLVFTPALAGAIRIAPNTCNAANPLPEASWIPSATLTISGTPAANSQGAYNFTLYVRDNNDSALPPLGTNDNFASKAFVLTVNP